MLQGRVCAALRLLSDHDNGPFATGQDDRDKVFQEILLDKHPRSRPLDTSAVTPISF